MSHDHPTAPVLLNPRVAATCTFAGFATAADYLAHIAEIAQRDLRRGCDITPALQRLRTDVPALRAALDAYVPAGVAAGLAARAARDLEHCSGADPTAVEAALDTAADTLGRLNAELHEASDAVGAR